ncbi:transporter substrate-binding domain-containing protein [Tissierella carlieri]|uniref:substrate-binding periplasmic protein n=1 Tax=Tissierella carlieri TaxID=689904 RepID=UPI001C108AC7|nr:transporter substrate-binding domain-containing protein [Tissierella carlieri]MBU5313120.1 transporter substrate-binding domain-containing protein [Tissierella carlieri]MDU5081402.1 transporter substrate-binding domain-containing protein [Bacillota bacterium]
MKKIINIGADPFPPYQYYDEDGNLKGSDYENIKNKFENMGYEVNIVLDEWKIIEDNIVNKKLDAAFQVQYTKERESKYFFSNLFRNAITEVVTGNPEIKLNSYKEIEENKLTLGVIANYTYGDDIDNIDSSLKVSYKDQTELLKAINDKVVDLGIFDKGVKEYILEKEEFSNIHSIKALEFIRPLYVVFSNESLRNEWNEK